VTTTAGVDLAETVRTALAAALPPAMVPAQVVPVDALPLTSRGKVDRARLPLPAAPGDRVAVEDPMVAWVCRLFAGVLRRPLPEVEPAVDFQRQGGDSILAMELVLGLRDAGLAVEPGDLARDSSPRAIARRFSGATTPAVDHWEPVVVLRPGRAGVPPLVLIHATPGDVLGYGNLAAALPDDLPCWGIVSRALHEPGRPHRTIPEMAVAYLEAIRARRGGAPFALGGWCYGGLVAYEMACLLHRTGQPAPLRLVLIETGSPPPAGLRATLRWHLLRARALLGQRPSRLAGYLRRKVALRRADTAVDPAPSTPRRSATVAWNMAAVRQYRAGPYPLPLDLFLTADPGSDTLALPDGGWTVLAPVRTVHPCAGGHADLLHPPHVATLAARLAARLGQGSAS
jgi:thioesterase domain-containing protein